MSPDARKSLTFEKPEEAMGKLRSTMAMWLDGFVARPDQSVRDPLGIGGERPHGWMVPTTRIT